MIVFNELKNLRVLNRHLRSDVFTIVSPKQSAKMVLLKYIELEGVFKYIEIKMSFVLSKQANMSRLSFNP